MTSSVPLAQRDMPRFCRMSGRADRPRYSAPIKLTAAEEDDEEWNLDPVPINENVRPRYSPHVKAPHGLELIPLTKPEELVAPPDFAVESHGIRPRYFPVDLPLPGKPPPREKTPLLQDIQPTQTDVLDQGRPDVVADVESNLNHALKQGDFDTIEQEVTAKSLTSCKTNALLKAFEVNKKLSNLIKEGSPETDDFQALASSVEEFTSELIAPLKSDDDTRSTFWHCLDYVVDTAIETEQKKFLSHPVVYNLLESTWYGAFLNASKIPWTTPLRWAFLFLTCFTLIDMFLFPILFALFYIVHVFRGNARTRRGSEIGFVVTLSNDVSNGAFKVVKNTMCYIIHKYGYKTTNYCVVQREMERSVDFGVQSGDETLLLKKVRSMEKENLTDPRLHKDLSEVLDSFKSANARPCAKKVLLVFVNDLMMNIEDWSAKLKAVVGEAKMLGINLVPIGIGEHPKLAELSSLASTGMTAFHVGDYESPRTLGKAIIQAVEGKDIYEYYLEYFKTPYFIFVRDSLSYLVLLGLHFAICLSPSTVSFSSLEWAIFLLFLGRIVMEVDQFVHAKKAERKQTKRGFVLRKFSNYFSDRWNQLDFIILLLYVITFTLRMITWSVSTEVYNNRPLAVAFYLYGLVAMFLTLRVFGHVMESRRDMGAIQIALFFIMRDVVTIFWQFLATILAFSLVITKIYIAEKSYSKKSNSNDQLACSTGGFDCWWSMTKHLSWSLLGIADLEPFSSVDGPSVSLAQLLYSMFLIMGVILLINMMIALLSNTYNRVEENSLREWSFKKAITIKSYSVYHPVPVPFNLVSLSVLALLRLWRRCCPKERPIYKTGVDEHGRKMALDKLVENLTRVYFSKHGYSFPLTDERKMDRLLHEVDGSRRMTNQIMRRVFRPPGCRQEEFKSGASAWESLGIGIEGHALTFMGHDFCEMCKRSRPTEVHGARYLFPFSQQMPRMEVLIEESGECRVLAVGVVFDSYVCHALPGWWDKTVGYHVDDGKIFEEGCGAMGREVKDAMAYRGDLVSCEVDFDGVKQGRVPVVFSLNGREVARSSIQYTGGQRSLFPFIGMGYEGIRVLVNMCSRKMSPVQASSSFSELPRDVQTYDSVMATNEAMWHATREECEAVRRELAQIAKESETREKEMVEKIDDLKGVLREMNQELSRMKTMK